MTVLAAHEPRPEAVALPAAPFVVSGRVHGRTVTAPASCLDDVLIQIGRWTESDPDATGHWSLHPDYSEPLLIVARLRRQVATAARRAAHLVRLSPGVRYGGRLEALCGETLAITSAEALGLGYGMPCERCVAAAPVAPCDGKELAFSQSDDLALTIG